MVSSATATCRSILQRGGETGRKLDRAISAVLALAVVALLADRFVVHRDSETRTAKSIVVLPLTNESGESKDDYFSDGLSEELIAALAQIGRLKMMGRNSSFRFKHSTDSSRVIGATLGVGTLLEGSVRRAGNRARIVAALINASDDRQLWSQTYDGDLDDAFTLQGQIAQAVAHALQVRLLPESGENPAKHQVPKFDADDHFMLGAYLLSRHGRLEAATNELRQAVAIDPDSTVNFETPELGPERRARAHRSQFVTLPLAGMAPELAAFILARVRASGGKMD